MLKGQLRLRKAPAQQVQPLLEAARALAGLQPIAHQLPKGGQVGDQIGPHHGVGACVPCIGSPDGAGQPRVGHRTAPQHQRIAARHRTAALGVFHGPDFAVGHHRDAHRRAHLRDQLPIRGRAVAIGLGAGMHHQLHRPTVLHGLGALAHQQRVVKAQAHLG